MLAHYVSTPECNRFRVFSSTRFSVCNLGIGQWDFCAVNILNH